MSTSCIKYVVASTMLGDFSYKPIMPSAQETMRAFELALRFRDEVLERLGEHRDLAPDDSEWLVEHYTGTNKTDVRKNFLSIHIGTKRHDGSMSYSHMAYVYHDDLEWVERKFNQAVTYAAQWIVKNSLQGLRLWTPIWEQQHRDRVQKIAALEKFCISQN